MAAEFEDLGSERDKVVCQTEIGFTIGGCMDILNLSECRGVTEEPLATPTTLESNFVDAAGPSDGYAFIGAVHDLVTSKNSATKADLILAAICHAIRDSDKTESEVLTVVNQVWPGANTDLASVRLGMNLGVEIGLVRELKGLDDTPLWSLTPRGVDDVDRQVDWVKSMRERTRNELRERARDGLGIPITDETAELWLERLVQALIEGIQSSQDAYFGRVDQVVGKRLAPRGIDQGRVLAILQDPKISPLTAEFLQAAAVSAFDPLDTFGNELVSLITTGCVLHSYVAGRDASAALAKIGDPTGQRALLDTPVLVDMVGPERVRSNVRFMLATAVKAGWEVVVCEHSLDELVNLMEREIPNIKLSFTDAHERGVKKEWYASLVDDQLTTYCVEVLKDGTYGTLDAMIEDAKGLAGELTDLGVIVRPHGNDHDPTLVEKCKAALERELATTNSGRSSSAIQRDAESMVVVWRRRRRQKGSEWPGGWIISSDRHIGPAYKSMQPKDPIPLTLSVARWSTLLAVTVPPAEVVELASAAATQLVEEAMWLLPSRFPSEIAMSLARRLSPEQGGSELDFRYAQLTLDDSLDDVGKSKSADSLAGEVLAARAKRTTTIQAQGLTEARDKQTAAERAASIAQAVAANQSREAAEATRRANTSDRKLEQLSAELAWAKTRSTRVVVTVVLVFIGIGAAVGTFLLGLAPWANTGAIIAVLLVAIGGYRWASSKDAKIIPLLIGAAFEAAAVVVTLIDLVSAVTPK